MHQPRFSMLDRLIMQADHALRTLAASRGPSTQPSPAQGIAEGELSAQQKRASRALMRVNHTGEVCAQALYQGQALTAKLEHVRAQMQEAADEEVDHLHWCEQRINELGGHTSWLNPLWYGLSFTLGAGAGLVSDKVSLGFVAATEEQVCKHLQSHLARLSEADQKSRVVIERMLEDEARHAAGALQAGGYNFPAPVKHAMTQASRAMTTASYYV